MYCDNCDKSSQYKYEYNGKCLERCSKGVLSGSKKCKCELDKCLLCPQVALNLGLCTECNTGYFPKENDPSNLLTCNENFPFRMEKNNKFNCVSNCSYYYYKKENNYYCTNELSCPKDYPKLKENSKECTDSIDVEDVINYILNIEKNRTEGSKLEQIKYYDNILQNIESSFTSIHYDTSKIDSGIDEIITTDKMTVTFTTTENQKNNINNNMTSIDLGECEILLRNFYNISSNATLYMKKMDIVQEGTKALKVEYDIYCKLSGTNLEKLNLTACGGSKISIIVPIVINDDLDKLNTSSGYYNDICYTTTSEDGTDISLKDRKNDFANKDRVVCQEGCIFSEYDYENHVAKCKCNVKESPPSIADMKIDKDKLLENFKDIKNIINFELLKCHERLFSKEGIINNYGCYLILVIIFFHILSIFIFCISNFSIIEKKIMSIASKLNKNQSTVGKEIQKISKIPDKKIIIFRPKLGKNTEKVNFGKNKLIQISAIKNNPIKKSTAKKGKLNISSKERIMDNSIIKNDNIKNNQIKNRNLKNKINPKTIIKEKASIGIKENFKNYIDEEINGLPYNIAVKFDKRSYCEYYGSLIKTQHNLICVLFNNTDYNSGIIKMDLFLVGFVIEYTINALFYNDDTMHEIYESKGEFDIETQLPIIVYSTIISYILNSPLNFLALTNDIIIDFKQTKNTNNIMKKAKKLVNILNFKFFLYFIISTLFLVFFWYYISMFGAIYRNTQIHLLKDILMSFVLSLFFPFAIYLLPGILRIPALSKKKKYLYNVSKFLQSF